DLTLRRPPASPFFPYTTLFRSWPRRSDKEGWVALGVRSDHRAVRPGGGVRAVLARRGAAGRAATVQPGEAGALRVRYRADPAARSEEHTSELQSRENLVCRLLL